jgi:hypothetical protein
MREIELTGADGWRLPAVSLAFSPSLPLPRNKEGGAASGRSLAAVALAGAYLACALVSREV